MKTGTPGAFVLSWSQTEIDGVPCAPLDHLALGVSWRWGGEAVRIDGLADLLRLEAAEGAAELRARAGRMIRRMFGASLAAPDLRVETGFDLQPLDGLVVSDGHQTWGLRLMDDPATGGLLLSPVAGLPPKDRALWITELSAARDRVCEADRPGVICFTPGTRIATPQGARAVETLRPGDRVLTADAGPQPVIWTGQRRISGARLHAMPHLRPVRIAAQALGVDRPEPDLLVSPQHRLLLRGPAAEALFHSPEVLVRAEDLLNDGSIRLDRSLREVTYVHLLFDSHQLIWANGVLTESFHPALAAPEALDPDHCRTLLQVFPEALRAPDAYGAPVRRNLTGSEAAILRHDLRI